MAPRLSLLLSLTLAAGCAGEAIDTDTRTDEIVNGAFTSGDDAVVALTVNGQQFCTGTLVTPTIIVTAAHCLPPHVQIDLTDIEVIFGSDISDPDDTIAAIDGLANPAWNNSVVANDVGVIALERPAEVLPVPMLAQPLDWMNPVGRRVRMVGYGITSAGGSGSGLKRVGEMEISDVDDSNIFLAPGPASTCSGDSGGPLFFSFFGVDFFTGIHSRSNCEDTSINERVDVHAQDFILSFIEGHGGTAECSADGLCAPGCEDPDPDCPCADDGWCTSECMALETNPDCAPDCGLDDGVCPEGCPNADPDCDDMPDQVEAGCQASGGAGGGVAILLVLTLLAIRRGSFLPERLE